MSNSRSTGLLLLLTGALTFLGTTNQMLPAVAFFPAMVVCVLGLFVFMRGNRTAHTASEARTQARLNPQLQRGSNADTAAARQAEVDGATLASLESREGRMAAEGVATEQAQEDEIRLYEVDQSDEDLPAMAGESPDLAITSDVSFPLEVQQESALADQIAKLRRLCDDGIISEDEFAVAKAKLLD